MGSNNSTPSKSELQEKLAQRLKELELKHEEYVYVESEARKSTMFTK